MFRDHLVFSAEKPLFVQSASVPAIPAEYSRNNPAKASSLDLHRTILLRANVSREAAGRSRLSRGRVSSPRPLTKERSTRQGCRAEEDVIEGPVADRFSPLECRSALQILRFTARGTGAGQRLKSSRHELLLLKHPPGFLSLCEHHLKRTSARTFSITTVRGELDTEAARNFARPETRPPCNQSLRSAKSTHV